MSDAKNILISGYYGFNNLGDELILEVLVKELQERRLNVTVLSQNPLETEARYGVKAIHRLKIFDIIEAMTQSHLFISGGGGLFQDTTGFGSVFYYGGLIRLARFFEVPVFFWGQGVGPLKRPFSQWVTRWALNACSQITVRDQASASLVEKLTGTEPEITADPVWYWEKPLSAVHRYPDRTCYVGISLRPWHSLTESKLLGFAEFLKRFSGRLNGQAHILLFPFQKETDSVILQQLYTLLEEMNLKVTSIPEEKVTQEIGNCDLFFGMRFHSLLLAILAKVPAMGLTYDPKVLSLVHQLGLQGVAIPEIPSLKEGDVHSYFNQYAYPDVSELRQKAGINFERLDELLQQQAETLY